ncbi:hypothetical protein C2G38_1396443 [Gigaspora rosea]|uniref:Ion transport domain-containing protein n=1 Tax=Gigaspora rosea TaxID=44941 RepID=A0A397WAI6_9GLOM|nr:hypothetical protein C2G38_1396443 [Gigaspora rosea]
MNGTVSIWAITFSTLFLELKFILFFRFMPFFGSYLAIIMNTIDKVFSFLIIFGLIIFAFAHALYLLLQSTSEISQSSNGSNTNMFKQFGSATLASFYMIITGDLTPISLWVSNNNTIVMILMVFFSFFILIYLMNLFIGILSNLINDTDNYAAYPMGTMYTPVEKILRILIHY